MTNSLLYHKANIRLALPIGVISLWFFRKKSTNISIESWRCNPCSSLRIPIVGNKSFPMISPLIFVGVPNFQTSKYHEIWWYIPWYPHCMGIRFHIKIPVKCISWYPHDIPMISELEAFQNFMSGIYQSPTNVATLRPWTPLDRTPTLWPSSSSVRRFGWGCRLAESWVFVMTSCAVNPELGLVLPCCTPNFCWLDSGEASKTGCVQFEYLLPKPILDASMWFVMGTDCILSLEVDGLNLHCHMGASWQFIFMANHYHWGYQYLVSTRIRYESINQR